MLSRNPVEAGHEETRAEILERAGGPVEQLERMEIALSPVGRDQRRRKVERFGANRRQVRFKFVAQKEGLQKRRGELGKRRVRIEPGDINLWQLGRDVQPSVRGSAVAQGLTERRRLGPAARADEFHAATSLSPAPSNLTPSEATGAR